jgi:hypothetical protein
MVKSLKKVLNCPFIRYFPEPATDGGCGTSTEISALLSVDLSGDAARNPVSDTFTVDDRNFRNDLLVFVEVFAEPVAVFGQEFLAQ